jgi:hypothetical protein
MSQLRLANVQVPPAPGTEQETLPDSQVAVALQDFSGPKPGLPGFAAARTASL